MAYIDSYGVEYSDDKKTLVKCPTSLEGSYTVLQGTTIIGEKAFEGCEKIEEVILSESVLEIRQRSFHGCKKLTSITIPENVEFVGRWAYYSCDNLSEVIIRSKDIELINQAFLGCKSIRKIVIPCGIIIKDHFDYDELKEVVLLDGSTSIEEDMFEYCEALTTLNIPSSVNEIKSGAFSDCKSLIKIELDSSSPYFLVDNEVLYKKDKTELIFVPRNYTGVFKIPNTVKIVLNGAFDSCGQIQSLVISENVVDFPLVCYCKALSEFIVEGNSKYSSCNGVLYDYTKETLVRCPEGLNGRFVIPDFVKIIQTNAFFNCVFSDVKIPESVVEIQSGAFYNCKGLTEIIIPRSVSKIGSSAFSKCISSISVSAKNENYYSEGALLIDKRNSSIVYACRSISGHVVISDGIQIIKPDAFSDCNTMSSVSFPSSLIEIGNGAFFGCKELEKISFSEGISKLGEMAFSCCDKLKEVLLPNSVVSFENVFSDWIIEKLALPVGTKTIIRGDEQWYSLKTVILNNGFETIEKDLFKGCSKIMDITIPASVKTVEANALDDCKALKNIHYEGTLEEWLSMDWKCFVKNGYDLYIKGKLLTDVVLNGNTIEIRDNAFYYCNSLQHIEIREGVEKIGASAFNKTSIYGDVYLPDSVKSIGEYAFLSCKNLKSISIPHNLYGIDIGSGVFRYCDALEKIDIRGRYEGEWDDLYSIDGVVFSKDHIHFDGSTQDGGHWFKNVWSVSLYHYPCGRKATKYIIPIDVQSIEDYAFTGVTNLTIVFRKYVYCEKNTFLNAKIRIQIPIGTKQKFIDGGYPKEALQEIDVERYLDRGRIDERCFELVSQNPYRMLGVFSDATLKEITANKTKLARYSSVGKTVSFDADLDALLSPLNRTAEGIEKAFADLSLPQDKIKYALTWFVKGGSIEGIALDHIKSGNYDKAFEILQKKETWSSLLNQGALSLARKDVEGAVASITKLIHEEDYRNSFAASIGGEAFTIDEDELAHSFIDMLMAGNESPALLDVFEQNGEAAEDDVYIRKKLTDAPVSRIKAAIAKAKGANPDDSRASYLAGKTLMDDTKGDLAKLKGICGEDTIYSMTADSLAKQILQCGINYYNESLDDQYERIDKAMELQKYALDIAVGSIAKDRCKENVDILLKRKMQLPPKEVRTYFDHTIDLLENYKNKSHSIASAIQLIRDCAPNLVSIKEVTGALNYSYISLSTGVVSAALASTIDEVNKAQEPDVFGKYNIQKIKDVLREAWRATLFMEKLDMEPSFKSERFNGNRDTLKKMIEDLHGFFYANLLKGVVNPLNVFGKNITVDLDMRTDDEYFKSCKTKVDYYVYLARYPKGKHVAQARQRLTEFEKEAWSRCKTMDDFKKYLKDYPYGIYRKEAKEKIDQFEEEALWVDSKNDDTIEAYNNYLTSTKLSKYTQEARLAIERLKEEHRKDEEMWKGCQKKEDYEKYLQAFPRALHKVEANERIEKFANQRRNLIIAAVFLGLGVIITLAVVFGG